MNVHAQNPPLVEPEVDPSPLDVVGQILRFALDGLSSGNGHHKFEDLCRHFARERIAPNILPATGPVSGGGDQGRDFETFRSYVRDELGPHGAFAGALNDGGALAFICTLQRDGVATKVKDDVATIMASGTRPERIYAFLAVPLPKAKRARLQNDVRAAHQVELEVLDREALAEALADPDVFWVAEQFLSIPATVRPPAASDGPELPAWYLDDRNRWRERGGVSPRMGELLDVIDGLRFATFNENARADLPFWLELVRALDQPEVPTDVRQRARYEAAVAQVRGLGELRPSDAATLEYLTNAADHEDDPSRLQDAATLLSYAQTAVTTGRSALDSAVLQSLNSALRERVQRLLAAEPPRTRRACLLEVLGRLAIMPVARAADAGPHPRADEVVKWIDEAKATGVPDEALVGWAATDIRQAMEAWAELAGLLETTPLYPVETWAETLDFLSPVLLGEPEWRTIEHAVDDALARIRGNDAGAERARDRALRLIEDERLFDALGELHQAIHRWWSGDNLRPALLCVLLASDVYRRLRLPQAAKQYALAAATGASSSTADDVTDLVPHAILVATKVDYFSGDWASALEHVDCGLIAQAELVDAETDPWAATDIDDAVLTVAMALRAAEHSLPAMTPAVEAVATRHGMLEALKASLAGEEGWTDEQWKALADDQLLGRPFADAGATREFRFAALGTQWRITSASEYRAARAAERLAAAAQIVLAELASDDLILLPASVDVRVGVADAGQLPRRRAVRDTSQPGWVWNVVLTAHAPGQPVDEQAHFTETLSTAVSILKDLSLLPDQRCIELITSAFERGLGAKLALGRPFEEMAEVVPVSRYSATPRSGSAPWQEGRPDPTAHPELAWRDGDGPTYSPEAALEANRQRYRRLPRVVRLTLARLRRDEAFSGVVDELRDRGWPDWQILTSIASIVINHRLAVHGLNTAETMRTPLGRSAIRKLMRQEERPGDPILRPERFTIDAMESARRTSIPAYAQGWDLHLSVGIPDLEVVERVLSERYHYWDDDADHSDPFA